MYNKDFESVETTAKDYDELKRNVYDKHIEDLIRVVLADGVITEKERQLLFEEAKACGINLDELDKELNARLVDMWKARRHQWIISIKQVIKATGQVIMIIIDYVVIGWRYLWSFTKVCIFFMAIYFLCKWFF